LALADLEAEAGREAEVARAERARAEGLELELERCRVNCFERDRRVARLEAELELSRSAVASQVRGLAALGVRLEELLIGARGQATRIRLQALREAAEVSLRARGVAAAHEEVTDPLLRSLGLAIDRVGTEWNQAEDAEARDADAIDVGGDDEARAGPSTGDELEALEAAVGAEASVEQAGTYAPADVTARGAGSRNGHGSSPRRVSIDIGPFRDFSQLVGFEDAANAIGATGEIAIRRFSANRASIEVPLQEPVDLLAELERRCDLEFRVRSVDDDEIILDLD
jgi:hypothetical protein